MSAPERPGLGYKLPNCGGVICRPEWARLEHIARLAGVAIAAGFDSLWLHDHVLTPSELKHVEDPHFHDPLIVAASLLSTTADVRVGIATLIVPLREPVVLAKQLSTLEAMFPGRLVAGVGVGRYESEFDDFGAPWKQRGRMTDEYLNLMRALWSTDGEVAFSGRFRTVDHARFHPRTGAGRPPLWVGGLSDAAIRRAARVGDGWVPATLPPAGIADGCTRLAKELASQGRDGVGVDVALSLTVAGPHARPSNEDGLHRHANRLGGSDAELVAAVQEYADAGVTHFLLSFDADSLAGIEEDIAWFAEAVWPQVSVPSIPWK